MVFLLLNLNIFHTYSSDVSFVNFEQVIVDRVQSKVTNYTVLVS